MKSILEHDNIQDSVWSYHHGQETLSQLQWFELYWAFPLRPCY